MNAMIKWLSSYLKHIGLCGNTGLIAGTLAGITLTILNIQYEGTLSFSPQQFFQVTVALILFCWIVILFLFVVMARLKLSQVAIPALFNVIIVVFLTTYWSWKWNVFPWSWLLGMLIGMLIGYLLCRFSKLFK
jgi:F0F1-type ATP synthase assembly protein I